MNPQTSWMDGMAYHTEVASIRGDSGGPDEECQPSEFPSGKSDRLSGDSMNVKNKKELSIMA